jgi:hypothetical protein
MANTEQKAMKPKIVINPNTASTSGSIVVLSSTLPRQERPVSHAPLDTRRRAI